MSYLIVPHRDEAYNYPLQEIRSKKNDECIDLLSYYLFNLFQYDNLITAQRYCKEF